MLNTDALSGPLRTGYQGGGRVTQEDCKMKQGIIIWIICTFIIGAQLGNPCLNAAEGKPKKSTLQSLDGVSPGKFENLGILLSETDATRPPAVTPDEIKNLENAGFTDDMISLLKELDNLTINEKRTPVSPAQAIELAGSVSMDAIRIIVSSEIEKRKAKKPENAEGEKKERKLTKQVITKPNGKQVIIYGNGDGGIGKETITTPDGRQVIVYYSGDPTQENSLSEKQREEVGRAWDLLERMYIHVIR